MICHMLGALTFDSMYALAHALGYTFVNMYAHVHGQTYLCANSLNMYGSCIPFSNYCLYIYLFIHF